jgi:glucokinase
MSDMRLAVYRHPMSPSAVIGLDAGGTKLLAGALTGDTELQHRVYRRWGGGDQDEVLATMVEAVDEVRAAVGDVEAVGFGIPSLVEAATGVSVSSVHLPLDDVPFRDLMQERLGLPVFVDNDVNLAALAEQRIGAARGGRVVVMLTLGTGIGGAIVLDGEVFRGADGAAGELGHVTVDIDGPPCQGNCPNRGCLEAMASGTAIGREGERVAGELPGSALGRALAQGVPVTGELVTDLALRGDLEAQGVLELIGRRLGAGLVGIVNTFNPDLVVIGGGASRAGEMLIQPARRIVAECALRPSRDTARIVRAALGEEAGAIGAALFARQGIAAG